MNRLAKKYQQEIKPQLQKEWQLETAFVVPQIKKIVLNMGVTDTEEGGPREKALTNIAQQFATITGQKPQITTARKDISGFDLRKGQPIGIMVTLRGQQMWEFFDKLISITLPRVKDFQGISRAAFDGHGNYSLGLDEQIVFAELDYDQVESVRGLQVTIVTDAEADEPALRLLELLGMPFAKEEDKAKKEQLNG